MEDGMPGTIHNFRAEFFKALGHPVRIKILEALRDGEKSVTQLQAHLGLDQSSVSQQLGVLRAKSLISARKEGTTVFYSVLDPLLFDLLDVANAIFNNHLVDTQQLLSQLNAASEAGAQEAREARQ
jgi:DNA-binding transcriptional ArsR family regulator